MSTCSPVPANDKELVFWAVALLLSGERREAGLSYQFCFGDDARRRSHAARLREWVRMWEGGVVEGGDEGEEEGEGEGEGEEDEGEEGGGEGEEGGQGD